MGIVARLCCGLRIRLILLILLVCTPLVALTLHQSSEDKRRASLGWQQRAQRIAEQATREEGELVDATRRFLFGMAEFCSSRLSDGSSLVPQLQAWLNQNPQFSNLGVISTNGQVIAAATSPTRGDFGNALFFRHAINTADFAGGRVVLRGSGRRPTLDYGYPVYGQTNQIIAVVFASLDLRWIERFKSTIKSQLLKGSTWAEIDSSGTVLRRQPPENMVGKPLPQLQLADVAIEKKRGLHVWKESGGRENTTALAPRTSVLSGEPVIGILSIPTENLYQTANRALHRNIRWLLGAILLSLFIGWLGSHLLIVKPIRRMARTSARLAAGDLSARTGLNPANDELGQLTLAFDQMAEALEHREHERLNASRKLQVLSHKLVEVQESERRQIARELHDEIGQSLTAAEMNLQAALQAPRAPNVERRLTASMQAVEQVLEQVHDLSLNLRPSMLDDLGLEPALRWLTRRQSELAGLQADFQADHLERRLHPVVETECFRITQEALTNVVRHSKAKNVSVHLTRTPTHLHLRVKDDGVGFDVGQLRSEAVGGASLGLLSMEERAALAGGGLEFDSAPGKGTQVHAWFPLRFENEQLPDANPESQSKLSLL